MDGDSLHITGISAEGHALSSRISESLPFIESATTDVIDEIVADVQGLVVNPRPNATGRITEGRNEVREYRYATLDRILDIARDLLRERGVVVRNFLAPGKNGYDVVTLLRHGKSGQYLGSPFPTTIERGQQGDLAGALTRGRRYNMTALLNIATEDDTDTGGGRPDATAEEVTRRVAGPNASPDDMRKWLADGAWVDIEPTPALGLTLLKALHANADIFDREKHPGLAGCVSREAAIILCTRFLAVAFGASFSAAWEGVLRCRNQNEVDVFRVRYDTDFKAEIDQLRGKHNGAVAYLTQHLIVQAKRAEARAEMETAIEAVEAAVPVIPDEAYNLVDAYGEAAGDELRDPVAFASAYASLWLSYSPDEREALPEHNDAALLWVAEHPEAAKILEDRLIQEPCQQADPLEEDAAFLAEKVAEGGVQSELVGFVHGTICDVEETAEGLALTATTGSMTLPAVEGAVGYNVYLGQQPKPDEFDNAPLRVRVAVPVPVTRGGSMDLARYYDAIANDLESVNDVPTMEAWLRVNVPVYRATGFPIGTRTKIIKLVLGRRRLLGMAPDEDV